MKININKKFIGYLWLSILASGLIAYLLFPEVFNIGNLASLIQDNYWLALIIFLIIICLRGLLFITPLTITLASSVFFPPLTVFLINSFGILISASIIYKFSHFLGFDIFFENNYQSQIIKIKNSLEKKEIPIIFAWSFLPIFPTDLIVYISASLKIALWKCLIGVFLGTAIINALFIYSLNFFLPGGDILSANTPSIVIPAIIQDKTPELSLPLATALSANKITLSSNVIASTTMTTEKLMNPFLNARERVNKKPFGIKISPQNSPVSPEKFGGYHTGVDFEILKAEENIDVPVSAICSGSLLLKKYATGYGGVAVQKCILNKKTVTIIYGHLKLRSIKAPVGTELKGGEAFAILGKGYSSETDGERKHLHLGIHIGSSVNILGYVSKLSDLSSWQNVLNYLP